MMNSKLSRAVCVVAAGLACLFSGAVAHAADGTVSGTVVGPEGNPLQGASVAVAASRLETTTDRFGHYRLAAVPPGTQKMTVRYLGFADQSLDVEVIANATVTQDVTMQLEAFMGSVEVAASPILEGQAQALSEQKNASNIVNVISSEQIRTFPDTNAAEATQRIPGVFIQRDQGEGRYVLIRGTEARLNSMQIDGERIPSPEGDVRQVALDVIPSDSLEAMRVTKTLTPDQDADAIGGIVNLELRDAPAQTVLQANVGGYYGNLNDGDGVQANFTWGQRFADQTAGLVLSGSYTDINRFTNNFEADDWGDDGPEEFENRFYDVTRKRLGLVAALDFKTSLNTAFRLKGTYNQFEDQEYRRRNVYKISDNEMERELKDRLETQDIWMVYGGGEHISDTGSLLTYKLSYAHSEEDEPKANYPVFVQEDVGFDPAFVGGWFQPEPLNEDINEYLLDEIELNDNFTEEDSLVARIDYSLPTTSALWKFGLKYRNNEKSRDQDVSVYSPDEDIYLVDWDDPNYYTGPIVQNQYALGLHVNPNDVSALLAMPGEIERDFEEDAGDYDAEEQIYAAYGMTEISLSDSFLLVAGLRYEYSDVDYTGYEVLFDDEGDWVATEPVQGTNTYGDFFPSLQGRWAIDEQSNVRAAITRSMARPNYVDLVPTRLILEEDEEIVAGNPELDPTTSWNYDLMYERFFTTVGVLSAGVFYKNLDNYIYISTTEIDYEGEDYDIIQPRNGEAATLWGLELAYQNQFRKAPSPWDGFGFYINYTWTDSEATYPDRDDTTTLPGQSENIGNIALSYEKGFFSGLLSYNISGKYIDEVGGEPDEDVYYDDHNQLDFQATFRISTSWAIYTQLYNLTDEPLRYYVGSPDQPIQEEYYDWWGLLGVKFEF